MSSSRSNIQRTGRLTLEEKDKTKSSTSTMWHTASLYIMRHINAVTLICYKFSYVCAATATTVERIVLRLSFPPNPPPILFTRHTTRLAGTPRALATRAWAKHSKSFPQSTLYFATLIIQSHFCTNQLSIHPSMYLSIYLMICLSLYPSIHPLFY